MKKYDSKCSHVLGVTFVCIGRVTAKDKTLIFILFHLKKCVKKLRIDILQNRELYICRNVIVTGCVNISNKFHNVKYIPLETPILFTQYF